MSDFHPLAFTRRRIAAAFLVVMFIVGASIAAQAISATAAAEGSGVLTVDGVDYRFTPTTCLITSDDFVAAGPGVDGDEQFWVSASSVGLDLAVGTESEIDEPSEDQLWLLSDDPIAWESDGNTVTAEASMSDHRLPESNQMTGALELNCADAPAT